MPLLLLLSLTTGMVDAASVLGLGKVFTANMTGNVVFLGFAAAGAPGFTALPYVVALATFMAGAVLGGRVRQWHAGISERRWLRVSAWIETVLLWAAALVAVGFDVDSPQADPRLFVIIALTAIAMGYRNATVRQMKVADLTTTVLTMTLTGLGSDSRAAGGASPNWHRRIGAVVAILIGAVIGASAFLHYGLPAPLAMAGALVLLATWACTRHASLEQPIA